MGDLSTSMQRLVDGIRSSTDSRHVKISEIKSDTHNLLERFQLDLQDMANALKEKLSSDETARKKSTQQFMNEMANALKEKLSSDETARKKSTQQFMNEIASDETARKKSTQQFMNEIASDRQEAQEIWRADRKKATQQLVNDIRSDLQDMANALKEFMNEIASDRQEAQEIWRKGFGVKTRPTTVKDVTPKFVAVERAEPSQADRVLEVIAKHPDGIRLADIGNELGADWRSLIGVVKSLVDDSRIEKIDTLYYPKN